MYTSVWVVDVYYLGPFILFHIRIRPGKVASLFLFNYMLNYHVGG